MKVYGLLNEKGGVGKTFLATLLATGLTIKGYKVVLVDADPQAHATISLGLKEENGLYNLLMNEEEWNDVLRRPPVERWQMPGQIPAGELYVLPAKVGIRGVSASTDDPTLLNERLSELDGIDVVIFDTPPTPSFLHTMIYVSLDGIIFPTECESLSLDALNKTYRRAKIVHAMRGVDSPPLEIVGVIPNKYERRTIVHQRHLEALKAEFGDKVMPFIPKRSIYREASAARKMIWTLSPNSKSARYVWNWINNVERRLLQTWQNK